MPRDFDQARNLVLEWLRSEQRDPAFFSTVSEADLPGLNGTVARRFMDWAAEAGFAVEFVKVEAHGTTAYTVHWTHRGASFVGFKQPPPEPSADDALLAGCAALLGNDWCRERLSK